MTRRLRIAALQLRAHDRDAFARQSERLLAHIDDAACGRDLLVLPEATFPAYVLGDDRIDDGAVARALEALRRIARERSCAIVAGAATRHEGRLYNSAVVIDRDGTLAGTAEKFFLWHFDRKWFHPGTEIAPVRTSLGMLGVLVCADGRMPEIARELVDRGAELLVMPTAWVTSGRDPQHLENAQADLLARVRALENGVPFVAANKCGVERAMVAYCGKSQIVDRDGSVLACAEDRAEELVTAIVTVGTPPRTRIALPEPPAPAAGPRHLRLALCAGPQPEDINERLSLLDADAALDPTAASAERLAARLPFARIAATDALDPAFLAAYRRAGYCVVALETPEPFAWLEPVARARALELRIYVLVFDGSRAYAIDPDGTIVAGTFDEFRIASAALDLARTEATAVAPGTDVLDGLQRVHAAIVPASRAR